MPRRSNPQLPLIRAFVARDADACAAIFSRAWAHAFPRVPRRIDRAVFEEETTGEVVRVATAENGTILGFGAIYLPESFVHHLFVDPLHHGRGVGRALLADAVAIAGGQATLKCQCDNVAALRFYRKAGWRELETGAGLHGPWIRFASPE